MRLFYCMNVDTNKRLVLSVKIRILSGDIMNFWILELIFIVLQLVLFIPFYFIWRKDCKEIGKENLAVPLSERFFVWIAFCPIWAIPILQLVK